MISKDVKRAMDVLQTIYQSGGIEYPRVDNNFIVTKRYDLFPHPPMARINEMLMPPKTTKCKVNKQNALLFLSSLRLVRPSTLYSTSVTIDTFFNDNLDFLSAKAEADFLRYLEITEGYLREQGLTVSQLLDMPDPFYAELSNGGASGLLFFHTKEMKELPTTHKPFFKQEQPSPSMLKSITMWDYETSTRRERKKKLEANDTTPVKYKPMNFEDIKEGLETFKRFYFEKLKLLEFERHMTSVDSQLRNGYAMLQKSRNDMLGASSGAQ